MKTVTEQLNTTRKYHQLYLDNRKTITSQDPPFLAQMREEAMEEFVKTGFPPKKAENYKYTHLEPLFDAELTIHHAPRKIEFDINDLFRCDVPALETHVLLVVNGYFYTGSGERLTEMDNGVIFGSLMAAVEKYPDLVREYMGQYATAKSDPFVALNTAFARDGVFLYVPKNQVLDKPVQIIHLLISDKDEMVQHRNLFINEGSSQADVIICDHTLSPNIYLTNSVTEAFVADNANLDLVRVQNEHNRAAQVTNTWIRQKRDSKSRHSTVTLHGGKVRNNLHVALEDEGCDADANGLFLIDKQQHVDNFTIIDHQAPHCISDQHYKGVLDDAATGAFSGKIHVHQDAQQTEAYQANNNMLLTDQAKMHTKPQLEIYADDVKCSHGATVGQIDEQGLFYLQSRGIPREEARLMLMYAFADDVISKIKEEPLRNRISGLVSKRLRGELSRCNNCVVQCYD